MIKISILGSCVTRDAFEFEIEKPFEVLQYIARSSFARFCFKPLEKNLNLEKIKSSFQRNMVSNDLNVNDLNVFFSNDSDFYIVDFIDERFGLISVYDTYVTNSTELALSFLDNSIDPAATKIIEKFSQEHFNFFIKGFDVFYQFAVNHKKNNKIIVNEVYWSNINEAGDFLFKNGSFIDSTNSFLDKVYQYLKNKYKDIVFLSYPKELFVCDSKHKWGVAAYHYTSDFYYYSLNFLKNMMLKAEENKKYLVQDSNVEKYLNHFDSILDNIPSAYSVYQEARSAYLNNNIELAKKLYNLNLLIHSSSIPYQCIIGKNSVFSYGGIGIIIHYAAKLGERCTIGSQVTIGGDRSGVPDIGDEVYISTGAKILGNVKIGTGAIIGANSVVLRDIEPFTVVAGSPAKKIAQITKDNFDKYSGFYWSRSSPESAKAFSDYYFK